MYFRAKLIAAALGIVLPGALAANVAAQDKPNGGLSGTWKLISWKIDQGNGQQVDSPYGANPIGWIMYHPDGHVCVSVMRTDRPKFAANSALGGTSEEIKAAFEGYAGYCGSYEVNVGEKSVTHRLDLSWFPNWIGTAQKRFFEINDNRVTLSTPPITGFGGTQVHRLVWERLK